MYISKPVQRASHSQTTSLIVSINFNSTWHFVPGTLWDQTPHKSLNPLAQTHQLVIAFDVVIVVVVVVVVLVDLLLAAPYGSMLPHTQKETVLCIHIGSRSIWREPKPVMMRRRQTPAAPAPLLSCCQCRDSDNIINCVRVLDTIATPFSPSTDFA